MAAWRTSADAGPGGVCGLRTQRRGLHDSQGPKRQHLADPATATAAHSIRWQLTCGVAQSCICKDSASKSHDRLQDPTGSMRGCLGQEVMAGEDCPRAGAVLLLQQVWAPKIMEKYQATIWKDQSAIETESLPYGLTEIVNLSPRKSILPVVAAPCRSLPAWTLSIAPWVLLEGAWSLGCCAQRLAPWPHVTWRACRLQVSALPLGFGGPAVLCLTADNIVQVAPLPLTTSPTLLHASSHPHRCPRRRSTTEFDLCLPVGLPCSSTGRLPVPRL